MSHGPLHAHNRTPGAGVLGTVSFRVRSQNFYGSGLRANYPAFKSPGNDLQSLTLPQLDLADDTVRHVFAFLCRDDDASCEAYDTAFRVDIFGMVAGWG